MLPLVVLAVFLASACIGQDEVRDEPSATPAAASSASGTPAAPTAEASPAEPSVVATASPTAAPAATPTATEGASPSGGTGSVEACTGSDDNRDFFAAVAAAFDWSVYCAALPARWSVESGQYRSAGGGWMEIAYQGPGGARFELHEGAFCGEEDGCVPDGEDAGAAAFGDVSGTLVSGDDGRFAVVVDRGAARSWLAVGNGLDLDTFRTFTANLVRVEE